MKRCPYCAEEIQDEAIKCRYCSEMLDTKQPEKWYFKTSTLIIGLLCVGPFALPLLWFNPRFSPRTKVLTTIVVVVLSYFLGVLFVKSLQAILEYYRFIFQSTL